jgi:DNA anti-recombination protein RmuC
MRTAISSSLAISRWRVERLERKLDEVITRLSSLENHFAGFQRELAAVNVRLDTLDGRVTCIERRLDLVEIAPIE